MTNCTYCGVALPDDTDKIIDHFFDAHVYPVFPPGDLVQIGEDLEAGGLHRYAHLIAQQFPPGSRTGYMDAVLDDNSAENMSEWLSSMAIRLAESIDDEAEAQGWARQPDSIRITMRVEPRWDEKGSG